MLSALGSEPLQKGKDAGKDIETVLYGGDVDFATTDGNRSTEFLTDTPTANWRALVPYDQTKMMKQLRNVLKNDEDSDKSKTSSLGALANTNSSANWNNQYWPTNGVRSYGRGSSGGSAPRIYSNPRSINNDKAATMYQKTPYSSSSSNSLRPSFSTKGSREAYKRQDM